MAAPNSSATRTRAAGSTRSLFEIERDDGDLSIEQYPISSAYLTKLTLFDPGTDGRSAAISYGASTGASHSIRLLALSDDRLSTAFV